MRKSLALLHRTVEWKHPPFCSLPVLCSPFTLRDHIRLAGREQKGCNTVAGNNNGVEALITGITGGSWDWTGTIAHETAATAESTRQSPYSSHETIRNSVQNPHRLRVFP